MCVGRICLSNSLRACPSITTDWYGYLPASPRRLTTTHSGPVQPFDPSHPKVIGDRSFGRLAEWIRHGRAYTSTGISTRCPSTTPVGLALGPGSPWAEKPGPGTLGHPAAEFLTLLSLLMPAFSLTRAPRLDHSAASPPA